MAPAAPPSSAPEVPPPDRLADAERPTRSVSLLLLLVVSAAASLALTRGLTAQAVPELQPSDVGKPFQTTSPAGFKAARDYDVVDRSRTEARRLEVRAAVLPAYDYNPGVLTDARQALHGAFAELRSSLSRLEPDVRAAARPKRAGTPEAGRQDSLGLLAARETLERRLFALEDDDFQALVQSRGSREVEEATVALLEHAYLAPVVASREELGTTGALAVRQLGGGRSASPCPRHRRFSTCARRARRWSATPPCPATSSPMRPRPCGEQCSGSPSGWCGPISPSTPPRPRRAGPLPRQR